MKSFELIVLQRDLSSISILAKTSTSSWSMWRKPIPLIPGTSLWILGTLCWSNLWSLRKGSPMLRHWLSIPTFLSTLTQLTTVDNLFMVHSQRGKRKLFNLEKHNVKNQIPIFLLLGCILSRMAGLPWKAARGPLTTVSRKLLIGWRTICFRISDLLLHGGGGCAVRQPVMTTRLEMTD